VPAKRQFYLYLFLGVVAHLARWDRFRIRINRQMFGARAWIYSPQTGQEIWLSVLTENGLSVYTAFQGLEDVAGDRAL
jgi:hypothetical protein